MVSFRDPGRLPVEIFYGPSRGKDPFKSDYVGSHFVADELGLGHLVISTRNRDESRDFYIEVLGFKLSDHIVCEIGTYQVDIAFLHTNPRHHSLAMGGPMPKRVHHFMLQVASIDDVGMAYDRARDHDGLRVACKRCRRCLTSSHGPPSNKRYDEPPVRVQPFAPVTVTV